MIREILAHHLAEQIIPAQTPARGACDTAYCSRRTWLACAFVWCAAFSLLSRHDSVSSGAQRMFDPGSYRCSSLSPAKHSPSNFEPLNRSSVLAFTLTH